MIPFRLQMVQIRDVHSFFKLLAACTCWVHYTLRRLQTPHSVGNQLVSGFKRGFLTTLVSLQAKRRRAQFD